MTELSLEQKKVVERIIKARGYTKVKFGKTNVTVYKGDNYKRNIATEDFIKIFKLKEKLNT